jgi:hypothetical protein
LTGFWRIPAVPRGREQGGWSLPFVDDEAEQYAYEQSVASDVFLCELKDLRDAREIVVADEAGRLRRPDERDPEAGRLDDVGRAAGVEREPDQGRRRRGGLRAEAATRAGHLDVRQPGADADAHAARPDRRVPDLGPPGSSSAKGNACSTTAATRRRSISWRRDASGSGGVILIYRPSG